MSLYDEPGTELGTGDTTTKRISALPALMKFPFIYCTKRLVKSRGFGKLRCEHSINLAV